MQNFQDTFETHKRSFINNFSICMTAPIMIEINLFQYSLNLILGNSKQNAYLAKHLWMLDSIHKKIIYAVFKDSMVISMYEENSQLTFTSSKLT